MIGFLFRHWHILQWVFFALFTAAILYCIFFIGGERGAVIALVCGHFAFLSLWPLILDIVCRHGAEYGARKYREEEQRKAQESAAISAAISAAESAIVSSLVLSTMWENGEDKEEQRKAQESAAAAAAAESAVPE